MSIYPIIIYFLGPWLQRLGLGDAEKFIGKPDSIAVRMPDYTVTSHLIEQVGPIAVTSANPSGEADTTHHTQVLARLGNKNVSTQRFIILIMKTCMCILDL